MPDTHNNSDKYKNCYDFPKLTIEMPCCASQNKAIIHVAWKDWCCFASGKKNCCIKVKPQSREAWLICCFLSPTNLQQKFNGYWTWILQLRNYNKSHKTACKQTNRYNVSKHVFGITVLKDFKEFNWMKIWIKASTFAVGFWNWLTFDLQTHSTARINVAWLISSCRHLIFLY